MSDELEASREYLQWEGRQYVVVFGGDESLGVMDDGTLAPEWERGESPYTGPWVAIPRQHVERSYRRGCSAVWDGQRVEVIGLDDPLVRVAWAGPASWGEAHDQQGSQYDGWEGWAPIDELTDIRVDESDYPPWTGPRRGVPLTIELRLAGDYLLWGGRDHLVSFSGDDWVAVLDDGSFPPEWERGENGGGRWVKVPKR